MTKTKAQKKAEQKYMQKIKQIRITLNTETETHLIKQIDKNKPASTYIKKLINKDIKKK